MAEPSATISKLQLSTSDQVRPDLTDMENAPSSVNLQGPVSEVEESPLIASASEEVGTQDHYAHYIYERDRIASKGGIGLIIKVIFIIAIVVGLIAGTIKAIPSLVHLSSNSTTFPASATATAVAAKRPGAVSEFPLPADSRGPQGITSGPDGNLWFTDSTNNKIPEIGRITPAGQINEFLLPPGSKNADEITSGPDGNLWFTEYSGNKIGRITPAGQISEFRIPTASSGPLYITSGPDGNLWFTEDNYNKIGRITPAGQISEFPTSNAYSNPAGITSGPDGNLWFAESGANKIGRITPAGKISEFSIPTNFSTPGEITSGPDGNLWFILGSVDLIGRITTDGTISEFTIPNDPKGNENSPGAITSGPDGNLWFTESDGNKIGKITPGARIVAKGATATSSALQQNPFGGILRLNDRLSQDNNNWPTDPDCQFIAGAYHVSDTNPRTIEYCDHEDSIFSNFAYQVQMTIVKGDRGGIAFRLNLIQRQNYTFTISVSGAYLFYVSSAGTSNLVAQGTSSAIHTGLNRSNVLAVVARGTRIDLYVNGLVIRRLIDVTYSTGGIGLAAEESADPTEVIFNDAKVWVL